MAWATEIDLDGGGAWTTMSFVQPAGGASISGILRLSDDSELPQTNVSICGPVGCSYINNSEQLGTTSFDFEVDGLPDGTYTVGRLSFQGVSLTTSTTATITDQQSVGGVELILDSEVGSGSISGAVTDADGDPIGDLAVQACKVDLAQPCVFFGPSGVTAADGTYRIRYLDDGTYRVTASTSLTGRTVEVNELVTVIDGAVVTQDLTLPIDIGTGSISGTISDLVGTPRSGYVEACRTRSRSTAERRPSDPAWTRKLPRSPSPDCLTGHGR